MNLSKLSQKMNDMYEDYVAKMQSCAFIKDCELVRQSFFKNYEVLSDELEDMALDVFEISCEYDIEQNLVSEKDSLMKNIASKFRILSELAHNIIREVEQEIEDYRELVTANPSSGSGPFKVFVDIRTDIVKLKNEAEKCEDEMVGAILSVESRPDLQAIKVEAENRRNLLYQQMIETEHKLKEKSEYNV